jgi:single-strand DNA-binding protein
MISQYAKKGSGVLVSGRLDQRSWEDKNGGGKRSRVEIVVEDFNFIGSANRDGGGSSSSYSSNFGGGSSTSSSASSSDIPDDIPEEINMDEVPF